MPRAVRCTSATRVGRLRKAEQFREAAFSIIDLTDDAAEVGDAYVTLLVHAGIAAADAICCARLGEHASGESHTQAVEILGRVDKRLAEDLATLLAMKTKAGYDHRPVSADDRRRAERAADRLVEAAGGAASSPERGVDPRSEA